MWSYYFMYIITAELRLFHSQPWSLSWSWSRWLWLVCNLALLKSFLYPTRTHSARTSWFRLRFFPLLLHISLGSHTVPRWLDRTSEIAKTGGYGDCDLGCSIRLDQGQWVITDNWASLLLYSEGITYRRRSPAPRSARLRPRRHHLDVSARRSLIFLHRPRAWPPTSH